VIPITVTLGEGNTPLVRSRRIGPERGCEGLWFKLESSNPSGSYKDRFIAAEVTALLERGARACVATSSGNTGSALAAYCARYGLRCLILVNHDAPAGKLMQMQAHGGLVIRITNFVSDPQVTEQVFDSLRKFSENRQVPLVVSAYRYCPRGMKGVEEIAIELRRNREGRIIDHVFVPVGGGGLFSAVVQGFQRDGIPTPNVHAVQPARCSTVVASFLHGDYEIRPVVSATRISGLSVPSDIDASLALRRLRECGGTGLEVEDEDVFEAQRMLMTQEGIYCEPAAAAALAGWLQARERGIVDDSATCVCLVTGHGFKDPASAESAAQIHPCVSVQPADLDRELPGLLESSRC
jgi:threonine synthase